MRRVVLGLAIAVLLVGGTPLPQADAAAVGAGVMAGTGTLAPGLTPVAGPQAVTLTTLYPGGFVGVLPGTPDVGVSILSCTFAGPSVESLATGVGVLTGGCGGFGTGIGHTCAALTYTRVGSTMVVTAAGCPSFVGGGTAAAAIPAAVFLFEPTTGPLVTTFAVVGPYVFAG
jgi:hypothetical protein